MDAEKGKEIKMIKKTNEQWARKYIKSYRVPPRAETAFRRMGRILKFVNSSLMNHLAILVIG